jgi:hypothetical protein
VYGYTVHNRFDYVRFNTSEVIQSGIENLTDTKFLLRTASIVRFAAKYLVRSIYDLSTSNYSRIEAIQRATTHDLAPSESITRLIKPGKLKSVG